MIFNTGANTPVTSVNGQTGDVLLPGGDCNSAADAEVKVVTLVPAGTPLTDGMVIAVRFSNANTATNPKLNVNNEGAKIMASQWADNASVGAGRVLSWANGQTVLFRRAWASSSQDYYWQKITQPYQVMATSSVDGLMSSTDKAKLDGIAVIQKTASSYLPANVWEGAYHTITQYGKMVIVNISGNLATAPSARVTLFNNLPASNGAAFGTVCTQDGGVGGAIAISNGATYIETRGTSWINNIKTGYIWGQLVYFTT